MSGPTYKTTSIKVSVSMNDQSPIFGEGSIFVSVEDEAAGWFIKLEDHGGNKISMDFEQLEVVFETAKDLMRYEPDENGDLK